MTTETRTPIVVFGTGGHGRETGLLIEAMIACGTPWELAGFLTDDHTQHGTRLGGMPILGDGAVLADRAGEYLVAVGIGAARTRREIVRRLRPYARGFPVLQHPSVPPYGRVVIGEGSQIHAGAVLTTDIFIGDFVILNRHVDVSHDCRIDSWSTLAPAVSLAGAVHVHEGADLGVRAACLPGVAVGAWSIVGGGAVVTRDVDPELTVVGVPARPHRLSAVR
jgi:sugar O-acyltransferase (sialic acid O-acetyltransferase NeuD family)